MGFAGGADPACLDVLGPTSAARGLPEPPTGSVSSVDGLAGGLPILARRSAAVKTFFPDGGIAGGCDGAGA